jgi:hypothetical protein
MAQVGIVQYSVEMPRNDRETITGWFLYATSTRAAGV